MAGTVGNMVADRVQGASVAKTSVSSSTDLLTQQAIAAVNGQVLPGAIGGVGSGFIPLDTSYNGNVGLFGGVGGVPTTLDAVTSNAAVDALAAYRAPYSAATLLSGLGMGIPAAPTPLAAEPFETSFAEPRPGVKVAGDVWPSFGGSHARTDEAELTGAPDRRDWTSQTLSELAWKGLANGLDAIPLGGGRLPPAGPGFALAGYTAVMGVVKAVAGLVPPALFNSGSDRPSSEQVEGAVSSQAQPGSTDRTPKPGEFSISDWSGYPAGVPKPQGPFRLVEGAEYNAARNAANAENKVIRREQNLVGQPVDVHEVQPVKFGGSPTDPGNKVVLPRDVHRQQVTPWWNQLQRYIGQ